jgi:FkbM family methyltransferase
MSDEVEPLIDANAALNDANAAFAAGDMRKALAIYKGILAIQPRNYWAMFSSGNAHARLGDRAAAAEAWRRAIESPDDARIGAYHSLLCQEFRDHDFSHAHLLDDALDLSTRSSQKRWHYAPLLLLSAVRYLALGDFSAADSSIAAAYDFYRDIDETELDLNWVSERLATVPDLSDFPNLAYFSRSIAARATPISYQPELAALPNDTIVLEIGAMDGIKLDPLREFITSRRFPAILVEPTSEMFDRLRTNYTGYDNVECIRAAISDRSGEMTMHRFRSDVIGTHGIEDWGLSVASASTYLLKFYEGLTVQETVPAMTFDELTRYAGISRIDVLQIDTEGHDWTIFRQISLDRWKIKLIHIEVRWLDPTERLHVFETLDAAGYSVGYDGHDVTGVLD